MSIIVMICASIYVQLSMDFASELKAEDYTFLIVDVSITYST